MPRLSVRAKRRRKMLSRLVLALMCAAAGAAGAAPRKADCDGRPLSPELYRFQIPDVLGTRNVSLDQYRGHVLLVQEPGGSGEEILNGIRYVRPGNNFQPNFPLFQKMDVNGDTQHPLFELLKYSRPGLKQ
ncbi:hypothetical protein HPB51_003235 [Rhipicephalus microplus]|uniref:Uncharacterized protein n=1 Tax=Rhipicephalus microplus TaxID=6941 RepID=A0A9J6EEP7_RHIMP|nr:hypothetical protein HPB51_003235 [Rhipicephalus microplus]